MIKLEQHSGYTIYVNPKHISSFEELFTQSDKTKTSMLRMINGDSIRITEESFNKLLEYLDIN